MHAVKAVEMEIIDVPREFTKVDIKVLKKYRKSLIFINVAFINKERKLKSNFPQ